MSRIRNTTFPSRRFRKQISLFTTSRPLVVCRQRCGRRRMDWPPASRLIASSIRKPIPVSNPTKNVTVSPWLWFAALSLAERLERGGPCWRLKLRWMGTQSQRGQMKGVLPFLVDLVGLSCRYKRFFSALAALVGPVQNIFFLTLHYFNSFVPIAQ